MRHQEEFLVIRADANTKIGSGHLMRCLALAQAWKEHGGQTIFVTACDSHVLKQRLRHEGFHTVELQNIHPDPTDLKTTLNVLASHPGAWLVLDGYHFDSPYQHGIKEAGYRLLVVDDLAHLDHYYADMVLNQNINARNLHYSCEPYTRLLMGTGYVLLRREFWAWRNYRREVPEVAKKVLVTMGGSDPDNVTSKVIRAIAQVDIPGLEAVVLVGPSNRHREGLRQLVKSTRVPIRLLENASNIPELMAWADVAISAGGTTVWELAFMGVPTLTLTIANNQLEVTKVLTEWGFVEGLDQDETNLALDVDLIAEKTKRIMLDGNLRSLMTLRGRQLVDGVGALRVINILLGQKREHICLRPVFPPDCYLLWQWANDRVVRNYSFSSEPIPWEQHLRWFESRQKDLNTLHFIATNEGSYPIGQVRFDISDIQAEISVSISEAFRGRGYGTELIQVAVDELFRITPVVTVHAYVKPYNQASLCAFKKAGFTIIDTKVVHGQEVIHLSCTRSGK